MADDSNAAAMKLKELALEEEKESSGAEEVRELREEKVKELREDRESRAEVTEIPEPKKNVEEKEERLDKRAVSVVILGDRGSGKCTLAAQILFLHGQLFDMGSYRDLAWKRSLEIAEAEFERAEGEEGNIEPEEEEERFGRQWFESKTSKYTLLDAPVHDLYFMHVRASKVYGNLCSLKYAVEVARAHKRTDLPFLAKWDADGKYYFPNTICGASQADIGVLVISARTGEFETGYERRRLLEHVQLAKILGLYKLIVVVNKMDDPTVKWSKERYNMIQSEMIPFLESSGFNARKDVHFLYGSNINSQLDEKVCPWWNDSCLIEALDAIEVPLGDPKGPFWMPIIGQEGQWVDGKVESGVVRQRDLLMSTPYAMYSDPLNVHSAVKNGVYVREAGVGEHITLQLEPQSGYTPERHKMVGWVLYRAREQLVRKHHMYTVVNGVMDYRVVPEKIGVTNKPTFKFVAVMQIHGLLENDILAPGYQGVLHIHSAVEVCEVIELLQEIDIKTKKPKKKRPLFVKNGATVKCKLQVDRGIAMSEFSDIPKLGRFTFHSEGVIADGVVIKLEEFY